MNEDYQWRQLGSIVNAVLMDARTKAIRKGTLSKRQPRSVSPNAPKLVGRAANDRFETSYMSAGFPASARPIQLELPFGITSAP